VEFASSLLVDCIVCSAAGSCLHSIRFDWVNEFVVEWLCLCDIPSLLFQIPVLSFLSLGSLTGKLVGSRIKDE